MQHLNNTASLIAWPVYVRLYRLQCYTDKSAQPRKRNSCEQKSRYNILRYEAKQSNPMPEVGITTCNLPQPVQALERVIIQHIWYSTPGIDLINIRGRLFNRSAFHLSICMGINQSSLQVCMSQPLRNQCKLHAVLVKMHRSTVAEVVWVQIGRYRRTSAPCAVSIQPQQLPHIVI